MINNVAIIDSIGSNLASLKFALERIDVNFFVTDDIEKINQSSHIILPGVGAARNAMLRLREKELIDEIINLSRPTLGICLGMQIFMDNSMEDETKCLGIISNSCQPFKLDHDYPVPHMGWNMVYLNASSQLTKNINDGEYFYFVHSYFVPICEETIGITKYPIDFSAVIEKDNFFGTQFHPEKSGLAGENLLKNFISISV